MFIEDTSDEIQVRDAHIWWNDAAKVIKVVPTDPARTMALTRAGYRYKTGAAYRHWQTASDDQRVREMAALSIRLVADGVHPTMVVQEFTKVRQFVQSGLANMMMASTAEG